MKVNADLWSAVRKLAKTEGVTLTALVDSALIAFLKEHTSCPISTQPIPHT